MSEELKVIITAEIGKLQENVNKAKSAISGFASDSTSKFSQVNSAVQKAGDVAKKGLAIAAGAITAVGGALLSTVDATAEYRNEQAKLQAAFQTAGASADTAKQVYNDLYRVLGESDTSVEAANHLAKLTTNQQELSQWTKICQGVYATFGDSLPIEGLTEAANETAKTGELTGQLADALNWAGVNEDEFKAKLEACNNEAEREALIRETLLGLYSEAAEQYEQTAEATLRQNEANAKMEESMARIGEAMAPVKVALMEFGAAIIEQLAPHIESFVANILPGLVEALGSVASKIGEVITWISEHWELLSTLGTIFLAVAAAVAAVSTAFSIFNGIMAITSVVTSPISLTILAIVAAVTALVAIVVACIMNWEKIWEVIKNVCLWIKEAVGAMVDAVVEWFSNLFQTIGDAMTEFWDKVKEIWSGIKDTVVDFAKSMGERVKEIWNDLKAKASEIFNNIKSTLSTIWDNIKSTTASVWNTIKSTLSSTWNSIKSTCNTVFNAIKSTLSTIWNAILNVITSIVNSIREFITSAWEAIRSICTSAMEAIHSVVSNAWNSIKETIVNVLNTAKERALSIFEDIRNGIKTKIEAARDAVKNAIEMMKSFFKFEWSLPPIKLPHFSISGKFSLNPPSVPHISVAWYAKGGVFDNPMLFGYGNGQIGGLGDNGAEAVFPLEKNTIWLDRIAERLYSKQGNTPIVLQVDGKTFAETSINSINDLTRQTGALNLILV